ncbi:hypothetical protein FRB94_010737 [Tulasnella sp. JGI-2019a]|nr:hypothetical protein FRB94_010737 [Tulasnella sp. JGI-2019a]KAG8997027.1 hypothetical protein FRB93_000520 [Tulasnella sp. JGI-2019a]
MTVAPSFPLPSRDGSSSADTPSQQTAGGRARHETFFEAEQPLVMLEVEGILFRLRRLPFMDSNVFVTMFNLPSAKGEPREGSSEECPIRLSNVTAFEFEQLARLLITPFSSIIRPFNAKEWEAILHLSTMWEFANLRLYAIKTVGEHKDSINAATVARIAKRYHVTEWLSPAYRTLCTRTEALTDEEGEELGLKIVLAIARIRETMYTNRRNINIEVALQNLSQMA